MFVIDANVWVSRFVAADAFHEDSQRWLYSLIDAAIVMAGPVLLLAEVGGAVSRRSGNVRLAKSAISLLRNLPNVRLTGLDAELADEAARLAADLRLKGIDGIYLTVAQQLGVPLITWDEELRHRGGAVHAVRRPFEEASPR